jgi:hypothetical protein
VGDVCGGIPDAKLATELPRAISSGAASSDPVRSSRRSSLRPLPWARSSPASALRGWMEASELMERADKKRERWGERIRGRPMRSDVRVLAFPYIEYPGYMRPKFLTINFGPPQQQVVFEMTSPSSYLASLFLSILLTPFYSVYKLFFYRISVTK